jgi:hypothetical protein
LLTNTILNWTYYNKLTQLEKYVKISNYKINIGKHIKYNGGGEIINNTYNPDKINQTNKEIIQIDNNNFYYNVEKYNLLNDNENLMIDIVAIKKKDFNKNDDICGSIQIDKNTLIASIIGLGNEFKCIKLKNGEDEYKNGDIVFQIMLDICKKENIKQINLTDNSYKKCRGLEINLNVIKTMTVGKTHYMKYGFKLKKKSETNRYEYNKKLFDSDPIINKLEFVDLILSSETDIGVKKYLFDILNAMNVENISIKNFLLLLMSKKDPNNNKLEDINYCKLIYDIYDILFEKAGYKTYINCDYYLNL